MFINQCHEQIYNRYAGLLVIHIKQKSEYKPSKFRLSSTFYKRIIFLELHILQTSTIKLYIADYIKL